MRYTFLFCLAFSFILSASAQNADIEILRAVHSNKSAFLKGYSVAISNSATAIGASVPLIMGATALITKNDELLKNSLYIGVSLGVDVALTYSAKSLIKRPRPYTNYPDIVPYEQMESYSFPSGHSSLAFTTATALTLKYPKWYIIVPSYFWACSVGYSRMNFGVHYPSDVLAGAVLGAGSAYVTYKVNEWYWKKYENKKLIGENSWL